jgi:hypothetical protein
MDRNERRNHMLMKTVYTVVLTVIASSFGGSCSAQETAQKAQDRIDAYTLLRELEQKLEKIPDTKEGCQAKLREIRDWQQTVLAKLMSQPKSVKYDFEYQWVAQDYDDSQACTQLLFSEDQAYKGGKESRSLKMMMELVSGDEHKGKGEAFVDMRDYPPVGEHVPVDMRGRTVSAYVYAPWGARGTPDKPTGFQVFVKSKSQDDKECRYGCWYNAREAEWQEIKLRVSRDPPKTEDGESMTVGFDPSQIVIVGVKMAAGEKGYKGPVFVDAVGW